MKAKEKHDPWKSLRMVVDAKSHLIGDKLSLTYFTIGFPPALEQIATLLGIG